MQHPIAQKLSLLLVLALSPLVATSTTYLEEYKKKEKIFKKTVSREEITEDISKEILGLTYKNSDNSTNKNQEINNKINEINKSLKAYIKQITDDDPRDAKTFKIKNLDELNYTLPPLINIRNAVNCLNKNTENTSVQNQCEKAKLLIEDMQEVFDEYLNFIEEENYQAIKQKYCNKKQQSIENNKDHFLFDLYRAGLLNALQQKLKKKEEEKQMLKTTVNQPHNGKTFLIYLAEQKDFKTMNMLLKLCDMHKIDLVKKDSNGLELDDYLSSMLKSISKQSKDSSSDNTKKSIEDVRKTMERIKKRKEKERKYEKLKNRYTDTWKDDHGKPILFELIESPDRLLDLFEDGLVFSPESEEHQIFKATVNNLYNGQTVLMYCLDKMFQNDVFVQKYFETLLLLFNCQKHCPQINFGITCQGKTFRELVKALADNQVNCWGMLLSPKKRILEELEAFPDHITYSNIIARCRNNEWKDPQNNNTPILFTLYEQGLLTLSMDKFKKNSSEEKAFWPAMIGEENEQGQTLLAYCAKENDSKAIIDTLRFAKEIAKETYPLKIDFQHIDRDGHNFEYYLDNFEDSNRYLILSYYKNIPGINKPTHDNPNQPSSSGHLFKKLSLAVAISGLLGFTLWYGVQFKKKNNTPHRKPASSLAKRT